MAGEAKTVWELDPHTRAKHVILKRYLDAWLPKLTKWNGRVVICDGFAGPGVYSKGEEGSPVIALKAFIEHSYASKMTAEVVYLFIEADEKRCHSLNEVISRIKVPNTVSITVLNEECEAALNRVLGYLDESKSRMAPTFAFIDPFGLQVPLDMVARLMGHPKCEVFITFMLSYLHRFIGVPEFEGPTDRLYGCRNWREALRLNGTARETFLRTLYQHQLETVVGAKYVRFFTMKDGKSKTIYDLFFATNHPSGVDAMKGAMWAADQSGGGYIFSDATDPSQETLFAAEPNWGQLFDLLATKFKGTVQPWPVVEEAIRRTPFRIMRNVLKKESRKENSRFTIVPPQGAKTGTLDVGTMIRFP